VLAKIIDDPLDEAQCPNHHQRVSSSVRGPLLQASAGRKTFFSGLLMHFGVYLMIAALVLMGLEVGYALYQLASFVL
jgi:hypothetical protein